MQTSRYLSITINATLVRNFERFNTCHNFKERKRAGIGKTGQQNKTYRYRFGLFRFGGLRDGMKL